MFTLSIIATESGIEVSKIGNEVNTSSAFDHFPARGDHFVLVQATEDQFRINHSARKDGAKIPVYVNEVSQVVFGICSGWKSRPSRVP